MNFETESDHDAPSPLVRDLLHAIGQPLTSLQMCVLLRDTSPLDVDDSSKFLHDMAEQVTLVARLFGTLRRVLDLGNKPLRTTSSELDDVLETILPRWQTAAFRHNITLVTTGIVTRHGDAYRLVYGPLASCLDEIVQLALESTTEPDIVTIDFVVQHDSSCLFRIGSGTHLAEDSVHGRYTLRAAKILLHSDGQQFTFSLNPLEVKLIVPSSATAIRSTEKRAGHRQSEPHRGLLR